jgi:mannosyltransferase
MVSVIKPVFLPRYLIVSLPALVLVAGFGITRLPRMAAAAVLVGLVALSVEGTVRYYVRDFDLLREDWRGATAYITDHERPGDAILFHANQGRMPFEYYARLWQRPEPAIYFPGTNGAVTWHDFMGSPSRKELNAAASWHPRVWLVLSHTNEADPATEVAKSDLQGRFGPPVRADFQGVVILLYSR